MSESRDAEKIRAALEELEPWADEEISHLERQFKARKRSVYLPRKMRCRIGFLVGLVCGVAISALLFYWLYPQLFKQLF